MTRHFALVAKRTRFLGLDGSAQCVKNMNCALRATMETNMIYSTDFLELTHNMRRGKAV